MSKKVLNGQSLDHVSAIIDGLLDRVREFKVGKDGVTSIQVFTNNPNYPFVLHVTRNGEKYKYHSPAIRIKEGK